MITTREAKRKRILVVMVTYQCERCLRCLVRWVPSQSKYPDRYVVIFLNIIRFFKSSVGRMSILWSSYPLFWTSNDSAHGFPIQGVFIITCALWLFVRNDPQKKQERSDLGSKTGMSGLGRKNDTITPTRPMINDKTIIFCLDRIIDLYFNLYECRLYQQKNPSNLNF